MRSFAKSFFVAMLGLISLIYLLNPSFGVFELIPDALPIVGNLDEATATAILLSALAYFGLDVTSLLGRIGLGGRRTASTESDSTSNSATKRRPS